jgi:hypothetical protein
MTKATNVHKLALAVLVLSAIGTTTSCKPANGVEPAVGKAASHSDLKGYPTAAARFYPKASAFYTPKKYDESIDERSIAILCDPGSFKFSIHANASKATIDRSYPERWLVKKDELYESYPEYYGEKLIGEFRRKIETCGPYRLRFQGDALNSYAGGEMGAEPNFANVSIAAGRNWIFPIRQLESGQAFVKLFQCAVGEGRQSDCPDSYATQIDGTYDPKFDKVSIRESLALREPYSADSGQIIERPVQATNAWLNLYWNSR